MTPILELESARLVLRQWHDDDLREFAALCADPQVMRYFPAPLTRLEAAYSRTSPSSDDTAYLSRRIGELELRVRR